MTDDPSIPACPQRLEPVSDPLQLPVAMEGAYLALERAYSSSGYPGPMPVRVSGGREERPAVDTEGEPLAPDWLSPTLSRDPVDGRISGDAGCDRFAGTGTRRGSLLVTGPLAVTRRFCQGGMDLEAWVLEALTSAGWLRLDDGRLVLRRGPDEVARYELDVTGG